MKHVTANSKEVKPGSIFFALKGARFDGHSFIREAIKLGASQIYAERDVGIEGVIVLGDGARRKLAELASEVNGQPTQRLKMIGVTGTSGKTTTTYLIQHILNHTGARCARLGTNGAQFEGKEWSTINTTPDALSLQQWFKEVLDLGATHVVMEVSSHAIQQERVWGIAWDSVVFLNLSSEHLDYHANLDDYFEVKARLFSEHIRASIALHKDPRMHTNGDSLYGSKLAHRNSKIQAFSAQNQFKSIENTTLGISAEVTLAGRQLHLQCPMYGDFQLENILAALTVTCGLGADAQAAVQSLLSFPGVPGRMELVPNDRGIFVFVDYAHKPEALEKVLLSIQGKHIITVFGCGGDRDKTKRPMMGAIAARLSNEVIVTSDNPRTEDPITILKEVESGITQSGSNTSYLVYEDRSKAIRAAIERAKPGDVVLIAGKGHENYQIFGDEKRYFDDREEAKKALGFSDTTHSKPTT